MSSLLLGLLVAVLFVSVYVIFTLKNKVEESTKNQEDLASKLANLKQEKSKVDEGYKALKLDLLSLKQEKKKKESKDKKQSNVHKVSEETYSRLEKEFVEAKMSFAAQKNRLEEQIDSLLKQLKEQDKEIEDYRGNYELERKSQQAVNKEALQLRKKYDQLDREQKQQKEKQDKLLIQSQEQKKQIREKEQEHEKLKKKLKQYNNFYVTMLSQKNMLEERLENWEKALRVLSSWVLAQQKIDPLEKSKEGLGELVSSALEITGVESLVEDEFSGSTDKENNVLRFEQR